MNTEQTNENILRYSPPNTSVFLIICLDFVLIDGVTMFEDILALVASKFFVMLFH